MSMHESGEMYLETIYMLLSQGKAVRAIDISEHMGYSKPSVSRAVGLLKKDGYITLDNSLHIALTDSGKALAERIYERHTVISNLFVKLGVDSEIAAEDACKIEHIISDESFNAIKKHIAEIEKNPADG